MSNSVIKYGDAISLQNNFANGKNGYLAVGPADFADPTTHVKWTTVTVKTPTLRGEQTPNMAVGLWQVLHIDGTSDGAEVKSGDMVALKNLHACDGSWLGAYNDASLANHPNALYRANTRTFEVPSKPAVQWQISIPDELPGTSVTENKLVILVNQFTSTPHGTSFLDINLDLKADEKIGEGYFVFTSEDESRKNTTGLWRINCAQNPCQTVSPLPDPCHKDETGDNGKCGGKHGDGCHHSHFHGGTHTHHHCGSGPNTVHSNTGPGDSDDPYCCGKCGNSPQGGPLIPVWSGKVDGANPDGTATGITLKKGDVISILSKGWVHYSKSSDAWAAPQGTIGKDNTTLRAKLGNGQYPIGNGVYGWYVPEDGELVFFFADNIYTDNSGSFTVDVYKNQRV